MYQLFRTNDWWNPNVIAWMGVTILFVLEFHLVKDVFVHIFMKLYEFLIQRNAGGL
jgi:hypothetical protein